MLVINHLKTVDAIIKINYMNPKLIVTVFFASFTLFLEGQTLQKLPLQGGLAEDTSFRKMHLHDGPTTMLKDPHILLIIDGKRFAYADVLKSYFNISNIAGARVIGYQNDSIKLYGKNAKDGVIIMTTKERIDWVSLKAIIRKYAKDSSVPAKKIAVKIGGSSVIDLRKIWFDRNVINAIHLSTDLVELYINNAHKWILDIDISIDNYGYPRKPGNNIR